MALLKKNWLPTVHSVTECNSFFNNARKGSLTSIAGQADTDASLAGMYGMLNEFSQVSSNGKTKLEYTRDSVNGIRDMIKMYGNSTAKLKDLTNYLATRFIPILADTNDRSQASVNYNDYWLNVKANTVVSNDFVIVEDRNVDKANDNKRKTVDQITVREAALNLLTGDRGKIDNETDARKIANKLNALVDLMVKTKSGDNTDSTLYRKSFEFISGTTSQFYPIFNMNRDSLETPTQLWSSVDGDGAAFGNTELKTSFYSVYGRTISLEEIVTLLPTTATEFKNNFTGKFGGLTGDQLIELLVSFAADSAIQTQMVQSLKTTRTGADGTKGELVGASFTDIYDRYVYNLVGETYTYNWNDREVG